MSYANPAAPREWAPGDALALIETVPCSPFPEDTIRRMRTLRRLPMSVFEVFARAPWQVETALLEDGFNAVANCAYGFAFEFMPIMLVQASIEIFGLRGFRILSPATFNRLLQELHDVPPEDTGCALVEDRGGSYILLRPAEFLAANREGPDDDTSDPAWVLAHEFGHQFQFFTTDEDREVLLKECGARGYMEFAEAYYGHAWLEGFADGFAYYFRNSPPGIPGKENKALNRIYRKFLEAGRNAKSSEDLIRALGPRRSVHVQEQGP